MIQLTIMKYVNGKAAQSFHAARKVFIRMEVNDFLS